MINPLVSIIIPTYNRAHLISETLDSVLAQTYTNWECIVVDDDSTDDTGKLLADYCAKDTRIQYHHRPTDRPKGANACRNYGFEISKGEYINWFDSDDLMMKNKIEKKVKKLNLDKCDFVVSKTSFFENAHNIRSIVYNISEPSFIGFVTNKQFWCTPDVMYKRDKILNIKWNEKLKSGQEFNFISKFLSKKNKGKFIDEILTHARVHSNSIHSKQNKDRLDFVTNKYYAYFETLIEVNRGINEDVHFNIAIEHLLDSVMKFAFQISLFRKRIKNFLLIIRFINKFKGVKKAFIFLLSIATGYVFLRGEKLNKMSL